MHSLESILLLDLLHWSPVISIMLTLSSLILQYVSYLLFYAAAATAYSNAFYGQGSGPILMDNVACTGVENGLINCTFDNNTGDCSHSEDAAVRCYSPPTTGEHSVYHNTSP